MHLFEQLVFLQSPRRPPRLKPAARGAMLIRFFLMLRAAGVPVSVTEFLALLDALAQGTVPLAGLPDKGTVPSERLTATESFYFLSRAVLVKDERHYDRFDRAFAAHFRGAEAAVRGAARRRAAGGLAGKTIHSRTHR